MSDHKRLTLEYRPAAPGRIGVVSQGGTQETGHSLAWRTGHRPGTGQPLSSRRQPLVTRHSLSPVSAWKNRNKTDKKCRELGAALLWKCENSLVTASWGVETGHWSGAGPGVSCDTRAHEARSHHYQEHYHYKLQIDLLDNNHVQLTKKRREPYPWNICVSLMLSNCSKVFQTCPKLFKYRLL